MSDSYNLTLAFLDRFAMMHFVKANPIIINDLISVKCYKGLLKHV